MKLTKKQLYHLLDHTDSPYIRGLGFIYIRYTQSPDTLWDWYEPYLDDEEEIDPKAGGMWIVVRKWKFIMIFPLMNSYDIPSLSAGYDEVLTLNMHTTWV